MTNFIECPRCGAEVAARGLSKHEGSRPCRAQQGRNERDERGLKRVSVPTRKEIVRDLGGELETLATDYSSGSRNHRGKLRRYRYADGDLVEEARRRYVPAPRDRPDAEYRVIAEDEECFVVEVVVETMRKRRYDYSDENPGDVLVVEKTDRAGDDTRLRKLYRDGDDVYRSDGYRVAREPVRGYAADIDDDLAGEALGAAI